MHITVDVNINAPELSNALTTLAGAISGVQHVPTVQSIVKTTVPVTTETDKSKFTVKMEDIKKEVDAATDPLEMLNKAIGKSMLPEQNAGSAPVSESDPVPTVTLEQVRAKLTAISQAGKQAEVKALITSFGVNKLTDIPKEKYQEALKAAEAIA